MGSSKSPARGQRNLANWRLPAAIIALGAAIAVAGPAGREALKYDRLAIAQGEWWRLVSGHFAHLGGAHFAMNAAGLCVVWLLVGQRASQLAWFGVLLAVIAGIDLGFWFLDPDLLWYVGLSGVLHGLLVAGALAGLTTDRTESLVVLVLVATKVLYEQFAGPMPGSEATAGGPVVVEAHLYGALAGLVGGLPLWRRVTAGRSI